MPDEPDGAFKAARRGRIIDVFQGVDDVPPEALCEALRPGWAADADHRDALLRIDPRTPTGRVLRVIDALIHAGATHAVEVRMADPPSENGPGRFDDETARLRSGAQTTTHIDDRVVPPVAAATRMPAHALSRRRPSVPGRGFANTDL